MCQSADVYTALRSKAEVGRESAAVLPAAYYSFCGLAIQIFCNLDTSYLLTLPPSLEIGYGFQDLWHKRALQKVLLGLKLTSPTSLGTSTQLVGLCTVPLCGVWFLLDQKSVLCDVLPNPCTSHCMPSLGCEVMLSIKRQCGLCHAAPCGVWAR